MSDVLGHAIFDYHHKRANGALWIHNKYGDKEEMPIDTYFRDEEEIPDLEWLALEQSRGRVLDIGAGAGSHAILLQEQGFDVTALDISPLCVEVMNGRGVRKALAADIYSYNQGKFDTLLLLMNGIGIAGDVAGLKGLLNHLKTLLSKGGQVLFDSSDVAYLYDGSLPELAYYGEIAYQYEYHELKGDWFSWLYIDEHKMNTIASEAGFQMEVLLEDENGQYLARLTT